MFAIERDGQFHANLIDCNQCGGSGQLDFSYHIRIECVKLDGQGFIIDNRHVPNCFTRYQRGKWQASCEQLAAGALTELRHMMRGRAKRIAVTIKPNGDAMATVSWRSGEALPRPLPKCKGVGHV